MEVFIYILIAVGCMNAGMGFWNSMAWPLEFGKLIARYAMEGGE